MPLFLYIGHDAPGSLEKRPGLRPDHLAHLEAHDRAGTIVFAGPLSDDSGAPRGSAIVIEAESFAAAREIANSDPYLKGGVFERVDVFETKQVFPGA